MIPVNIDVNSMSLENNIKEFDTMYQIIKTNPKLG